MAEPLSPPRLLPSGDSAITVEFSRTIDDAANRRVLALDRVIAAEPIVGITETVPTYRSLLVHYDARGNAANIGRLEQGGYRPPPFKEIYSPLLLPLFGHLGSVTGKSGLTK